MNFTREPIIETVITPREGCKLVVRSSKGTGQEDYFVDAVEVVSFGHSFFFRSQERPKSFLVPVSDYEILEVKETRMVLKNVSTDRSIKIGGGREAPPRPREEEISAEQRSMSKREKRRRGRRGRHERPPEALHREQHREPEQPFPPEEEPSEEPEELAPQASGTGEKSPSFISKLFPPPSTLIKESLSRYKPTEEESKEKESFEEIEQPTPTDKESEEENEE